MNNDLSNAIDLNSEDGRSVVKNILDAGAKAIEAGQFEEAEKIYRGLIDMVPEEKDAYNGLGAVYGLSGNLRAAEHQFRNAIKYGPNEGAFHRNLGSILLQRGRFRRAGEELAKALELDPGDLDAQYKMATVHKGRGNFIEYEAGLRKLLKQESGHIEASNELGCYLISKDQLEEARDLLKTASQSDIAGPLIHVNYGNALIISGYFLDACKSFERAVGLDPLNVEYLIGLATVERNLGELESALTHAEKASSLAPAYAPARNLLGTVYKELGNYDEALSLYDEALEKSDEFVPAKINRSVIRLLRGEWAEGFREYEMRREDPASPFIRDDLDCPLWDGSPLEGRKIFLYAEQGFGDAIQFSRFAKQIAGEGGKVSLEVQPELRRLMMSLDESVEIAGDDSENLEADVYAPLMSLGALLNLNSEALFLPRPYLKAPEPTKELTALIAGTGGLKVGLNWKGSSAHKEDAKRSIDIRQFESLMATDGVQFFNLNVNSDIDGVDIPEGLADISSHITDFADAASVISQLDLVISVDTATVHLAGALGCPCWTLVSFVPDWRWGLERQDSPWYESVKLYRQTVRSDWSGVLDNLEIDLQNLRDS